MDNNTKTRRPFTPGPWHWADTEALRDEGEHDVIAIDCDGDGCDLNVDDPDARLIAAAPELYGALVDMILMQPGSTKRAHAAIAKAEGR